MSYDGWTQGCRDDERGPDPHEDPCRFCSGCFRCTTPDETEAAPAAEQR